MHSISVFASQIVFFFYEKCPFFSLMKSFKTCTSASPLLPPQILMVQYFTSAFHVRPLEGYQWMWCLFFAFSELIWGQLVFTLPKAAVPRCIRCCSRGVTEEGKGCCDNFSRIRGCRKVRRQVKMLDFAGGGRGGGY